MTESLGQLPSPDSGLERPEATHEWPSIEVIVQWAINRHNKLVQEFAELDKNKPDIMSTTAERIDYAASRGVQVGYRECLNDLASLLLQQS